MMNKQQPIGLFDSGIGGLSVLKQFIRFLPFESYIYLGDTARVPYGNKSPETVIKYSKQCVKMLLENNVKLIVIACNTASSLALNSIKEITDVPVIGMIYPAASAALRATNNKRIGIIGTRATVSSKAYQNAIFELSKDESLKVFSNICPLFVPLVEEGLLEHNATRLIAEEYLSELIKENIDTLVLGCTHYPLLSRLISELMPSVSLIDSGEHSAVIAIRQLAELGLLVEEQDIYINKPKIDFYVTDMPATFDEVAKQFLGFQVEQIKSINIE